MTSHWGRVPGDATSTVANCSGNTMSAISSRQSSRQHESMPPYGNMPTGASPASAFGGRASAGRNADLNSSHRDDHSTSKRGGSGQRVMVSGMVSTSGIKRGSFPFRKHAGPGHSSNLDEALPRFQHPDRVPRENAEGARRKTA